MSLFSTSDDISNPTIYLKFVGRVLSLAAMLAASDSGHTCSLLISPTQLKTQRPQMHASISIATPSSL